MYSSKCFFEEQKTSPTKLSSGIKDMLSRILPACSGNKVRLNIKQNPKFVERANHIFVSKKILFEPYLPLVPLSYCYRIIKSDNYSDAVAWQPSPNLVFEQPIMFFFLLINYF